VTAWLKLRNAIPLTAEQAEELDRRLEAYRKDENPGLPWAEVLRKIEESGVRQP
jgi:putative addiction module component (TIGR02574 family)